MKYIICQLLALICSFCSAENELRTWTSGIGSTIEARLVKADGGTLLIERADGNQISLHLDQLSEAEQTYVANLPEQKGNTRIEGIDAEPGQISHAITCADDPQWSYHLYLPEAFHDGRTWPVWFIMSAGGGENSSAMRRYTEGADKLGCIIVLSVESKNNFADSDLAMEAMAEDVYERLPVEKDLAFASGMSGGSRMAYLLAERNKNIQGVIACGSGSGIYLKEKDFRQAKLRRSTYIYSLIGTNCFNQTEAFESHLKLPDDNRLRYFPGKHVWANTPLITEAMARVMGAALENSSNREWDQFRDDYARTMLSFTQSLVAEQPWEAYYWAEFLADFPVNRDLRGQAQQLARQLKNDPTVTLAIAAEKEIIKFGKKHFEGVYCKTTKCRMRTDKKMPIIWQLSSSSSRMAKFFGS